MRRVLFSGEPRDFIQQRHQAIAQTLERLDEKDEIIIPAIEAPGTLVDLQEVQALRAQVKRLEEEVQMRSHAQELLKVKLATFEECDNSNGCYTTTLVACIRVRTRGSGLMGLRGRFTIGEVGRWDYLTILDVQCHCPTARLIPTIGGRRRI